MVGNRREIVVNNLETKNCKSEIKKQNHVICRTIIWSLPDWQFLLE